jgi:hypothetical protein
VCLPFQKLFSSRRLLVRAVVLDLCRTGYENSAAAQAAAASSGTRRGPSAAQYYYSGPDDFDPEEIFNMFFGLVSAHSGAALV